MKKQAYFIWAYAIILLIGGVIGFLKAGSVVSIATSSCFAALLFATGYGIKQNCSISYYTTIGLLVSLLAFFAYRYLMTHQFMPAGLMIILTGLLVAYLGIQCKHMQIGTK